MKGALFSYSTLSTITCLGERGVLRLLRSIAQLLVCVLKCLLGNFGIWNLIHHGDDGRHAKAASACKVG